MSGDTSNRVGSLLAPAPWLFKPFILALVVGLVAIGGFSAYLARRDYRDTVNLWKTQLNASVRYRTWTLLNSLQTSQDDVRVLADFASTRELLRARVNGTGESPGSAAVQKQILDLFDQYNRVYEYAAMYLLNGEGKVVVMAPDSAAGNSLHGNPVLKAAFEGMLSSGHYSVDLATPGEKEVLLTFIMPVFADGTTGKPQRGRPAPIGAVAIIDPFVRELAPLLTATNLSGRTVETVMTRLEANGPRYLSLRHDAPVHALRQRDTLLEATVGAVSDFPQFGSYVDDRGIAVMAAMQKIPSIHSVVVSKVETSEVLAGFYGAARREALAATALALAYVGTILLLRRNAIAREMQRSLGRQLADNQRLESTVAERTSQLVEVNRKLFQELGERERAEQQVRTLNADLDRRVQERTAELKAANEELEAFSYSVSHDLRAPLRAIDGFSKILLQDYAPQLPTEAQTFLELANNSAVQMRHLIDCLLDFSKFCRKPLEKLPLTPAAIVSEAWRDLGSERDGRKVEMVIRDLPTCEADPVLLKQIFANLLSNAIKYSRTKENARIEVGQTNGVYYVRDNGVGFDMRNRDKLFGVFQRLHRVEDFEGIGVGLAIVQRIVHRHGGQVWADGVVNQGARFYFTLISVPSLGGDPAAWLSATVAGAKA